MTNSEIVGKLQSYVRELRHRHENLYRVQAYRQAAETLMRLDKSVEDLVLTRGRNALEELPGIGRHLAETIATFVKTGEWYANH